MHAARVYMLWRLLTPACKSRFCVIVSFFAHAVRVCARRRKCFEMTGSLHDNFTGAINFTISRTGTQRRRISMSRYPTYLKCNLSNENNLDLKYGNKETTVWVYMWLDPVVGKEKILCVERKKRLSVVTDESIQTSFIYWSSMLYVNGHFIEQSNNDLLTRAVA